MIDTDKNTDTSNYVERELCKIKVKVLNEELPVWIDSSFSLTQENDERLDNNYWSASYYSALKTLKALQDRNVIEVRPLGQLCKVRETGFAPDEDGDCPLIEGNNIRPNVVYPLFEKFATVSNDKDTMPELAENDIILTKDGMPAAYAYISKSLLNTLKSEFQYPRVAFSTHVYRMQLNDEYYEYAPYIVQVMNSRLGQALTRRFISGSVTPTLRSEDVDSILVPLPRQDKEKILKESQKQVEALQLHVMEIMKNVKPSNDLMTTIHKLGDMNETKIPKLPQNWSGGGRRDLHGYYKD